jgi:hypothetical protein
LPFTKPQIKKRNREGAKSAKNTNANNSFFLFFAFFASSRLKKMPGYLGAERERKATARQDINGTLISTNLRSYLSKKESSEISEDQRKSVFSVPLFATDCRKTKNDGIHVFPLRLCAFAQEPKIATKPPATS